MASRWFHFVSVTHTYMLEEAGAEKLVAVARALTLDRVHDPEDIDVGILHMKHEEGDELPLASAIMEVPFPEALVGATLVASTSHVLNARETAEMTRGWPKGWDEEREE